MCYSSTLESKENENRTEMAIERNICRSYFESSRHQCGFIASQREISCHGNSSQQSFKATRLHDICVPQGHRLPSFVFEANLRLNLGTSFLSIIRFRGSGAKISQRFVKVSLLGS